MQPYEGYDTGQNRTCDDTEFGVVEQVELSGVGGIERECGYEYRHSETDTAKHGYRRHHVPVAVCGHWGEFEFDGNPRKEEYAYELAQHKTCDDGDGDAFKDRYRVGVEQEYSGICKCKKRYNNVVDKSVESIFHVLQRRYYFVGSAFNLFEPVHLVVGENGAFFKF